MALVKMDCAVEVAKANAFWLGKPAGKPKWLFGTSDFLMLFWWLPIHQFTGYVYKSTWNSHDFASFDVVWFYKQSKTTGEWFRFVLVQMSQLSNNLLVFSSNKLRKLAEWLGVSKEKAASAKGAIATTTAQRDDWNDVTGWSESVVTGWFWWWSVHISAYCCGKNLKKPVESLRWHCWWQHFSSTRMIWWLQQGR